MLSINNENEINCNWCPIIAILDGEIQYTSGATCISNLYIS